MSERAVLVRGLAKRFGPITALRDVDLEVASGSLLAVLGPNGAGKTTLLRVLAGLVRPSAGRVQVGREEHDRRRVRGRVGYIAHATFLYGALSAHENLVFYGRLHGVADPERRARALLEEQGLAAVADRRAGGFSRGMAQRLAIARGLVHDPEVVLLDEPFTGLDPSAADRLAARLGSLREQGRAVVLVTHDLARAAALANGAVLLIGGRVATRHGAPTSTDVLERDYRAALEDAL